MNYRHIYHAGNFADIFKHVTLTLIIRYLQRKPAAFRLIDAYAGIGLYDLHSDSAAKTAEWQSGIQRFLAALAGADNAAGATANISAAANIAPDYAALAAAGTIEAELLAPYLQALNAANPQGGLRYYPGSPWLGRHLFRKQDRLTAVELHSEDYESLRQNFSGDYQSRILHLDGRLALKSLLPPKEKRGLILIDPPFEQRDEFAALRQGLGAAMQRFPYGIYMIWYPLKNYAETEAFALWLKEEMAAEHESGHNIGSILQAELRIRQKSAVEKLDGSGLILINPPYILAEQLALLEPLFLRAFAEDKSACLRQNWLRRA